METVEAPAPGPCQARANGFSLHAGLVVPAGQRDRLERVCRYALRPPVPVERLHPTEDGLVRLSLRQPWHDGTTDLVFTPMEFLERLAVLVPRPRINLVLYFGVLGARAALRADVVRSAGSVDRSGGLRARVLKAAVPPIESGCASRAMYSTESGRPSEPGRTSAPPSARSPLRAPISHLRCLLRK